jgi:hypothetical protein
MDAEQKIDGFGREEFQGWINHPFTKFIKTFLQDKSAYYQQIAMEHFLAGTEPKDFQALRGQIIELDEIRNVSWDSISAFYEQTQKTEDNEQDTENL